MTASPPLVCAAVLDINAHILPGIHAATPHMDDALAASRALVAAGVAQAVAPAMVGSDPAADIAAADRARAQLQGVLDQHGVPLRLLPGAVLPLRDITGIEPGLLASCTAGGGGRWLVATLPDAGWPLDIGGMIDGLQMAGLGLVLAHPERAEAVQLAPDRLRDVLGRGALVQLAAGSMDGGHGPRAERTAFDLLRNGMVTVLASDAPSPTGHVLDLATSLDVLERVLRRPREEVAWMVDAGPRRIAAGEPVRPPRLVPQPRAAGA